MKHEIECIIDVNEDYDVEIGYQSLAVADSVTHKEKGTLYIFDIDTATENSYEITVLKGLDEKITFIEAKDLLNDDYDLLSVLDDPEKFKENVIIWAKETIDSL